ncbi:MAG: efflux RND transporter periplasmic adaptor subunit [Phycisphaerales bacterium]|nr:efflux RND transporter periplasmic adaptor subunit [Phycisphaerales bacterium]
MWKWVLGVFLAILLALAGVGYWAFSSGKLDSIIEQFKPGGKPTQVRLAVSERGDLVRVVSAPGQIEPKIKVEISAQVSARIIALPFREGQRVKKGDVVARLEQEDLAALVDSAKAELKSREAQLEGAKAAFAANRLDLNRQRELYSTNDIAKAVLDQTEAEFARAEAQLKSAEFAIEIARANITRAQKDFSNTTIEAPFDGVITRVDADPGELVVVGTLNNPGSVFMEIADLSQMLLKTRVDEANIAPVKVGQKATVYVNSFPDTSFMGTVEKVGLKRLVDRDGTAYFECDVLIEKPDDVLLRHGMTANADIQVEVMRDVVKVPSQTVLDRAIDDLPRNITDNNPLVDMTKKFTRVVYVLDGEKARAVPVTIGASDLTDTVITAGLEPGLSIVAGPFKILQGLKHDQRVMEEKPEEKDASGKDGADKAEPSGTSKGGA